MIKYTEQQRKDMVKLRKGGLSFKDIAAKLNIGNITTVSQVCSAAGLPKNPSYPKTQYESGQRYSNFVLLNKSIKDKRKVTVWQCKCDCGKEFTITTKQIRRGQKSCGCLSISGRFHKLESKQVIGTHKYNHYKTSARTRNLEWQLSLDRFIELLFSVCHYCGGEPSTAIKLNSHSLQVNGVDRINSDIGYLVENCVPCCKFCNRAKGASSVEEFLDWINRWKANENSKHK